MNFKPLLAEFIGTFALIFVGVGAIAADATTGGKLGLTGIALAHGLTIAVMVTATAATSGGHLNPAVSFGLFLAGKINARNTLAYVAAQSLGGIVAALAIQQILSSEVLRSVQMGTPLLAPTTTIGQGLIAELVLTFFLVFVVLGTAVDPRAPRMGGLFIGLTVALDIMVGGPITGAAMNPARHLGPALVGGYMSDAWLYWVGPLAGGAIAGMVWKHVFDRS